MMLCTAQVRGLAAVSVGSALSLSLVCTTELFGRT